MHANAGVHICMQTSWQRNPQVSSRKQGNTHMALPSCGDAPHHAPMKPYPAHTSPALPCAPAKALCVSLHAPHAAGACAHTAGQLQGLPDPVCQLRCCSSSTASRPSIGMRADPLAEAEALGALMQREHEPVAQPLLALVLDQVQLVEARVRRRQLLLRAVRLVDAEALRAADALRACTARGSLT